MFEVGKPQVTMTSLELVDFINQNEERESELRHDHFMAKVPKVLGEAAPKFLGTAFYTVNGAQRSQPIYKFPKREACLMAMSYSYEQQAKVYDRMTALAERQPDPMLILADPVAMRKLLLTCSGEGDFTRNNGRAPGTNGSSLPHLTRVIYPPSDFGDIPDLSRGTPTGLPAESTVSPTPVGKVLVIPMQGLQQHSLSHPISQVPE